MTQHLKEPLEMKASLWGALITAALNHLLSEGLCRLSALQTGWKGKKESLERQNDVPQVSREVRVRSRKGSQASCLLALLLSPTLHQLSHCQSPGTQQTQRETTYPEWSALSQIKVPLLHKLSIFNRTILVPLLSPCASLQHTRITQGDWYVTEYTKLV